jgi:hypothetical protein
VLATCTALGNEHDAGEMTNGPEIPNLADDSK